MISTFIGNYACFAVVTACHGERATYDYNASSDWEYSGWCDIEFELRSFKNPSIRATWLEKRMTDKDRASIESALRDQIKKGSRYDD